MAALSVSKIRLSDVQKALGYFPNSVAGVCKYSGINKWSRYKPFRSAALDYGNYNQLLEGLRAANFGLSWNGGDTEDSFVYLQPQGGASSPYRLGLLRSRRLTQSHTASGTPSSRSSSSTQGRATSTSSLTDPWRALTSIPSV